MIYRQLRDPLRQLEDKTGATHLHFGATVDLDRTIGDACSAAEKSAAAKEVLPPRVRLSFEDGTQSIEYDVVVFADGTHSYARRLLLEREHGLEENMVSSDGGCVWMHISPPGPLS